MNGQDTIDFTRFAVATFDCYGTLIDWETGILNALRPLLAAHGVRPGDDEILEAYGRSESAAQRSAWSPYAEVLARTVEGVTARFGFVPDGAERGALARSIGDWPAFPDTPAALATLQRHYRLIVLSNIDDDLYARTAPALGVDMADVVTAEQLRSYKPAPAHFRDVCARTGLPPGRILHIAQSLYHDIAPARALGFTTVWVNRRKGREGTGATPPAVAQPHREVPDLETLARQVDDAFRGAAG